MGLSIPKTRWILFLLAPVSLDLGDSETATLLDAQYAFSSRVQELLKEDGLRHLDLTDESIDDDQYLAYLIYCSYVGHGVGLFDIQKKDFGELDRLVTEPTKTGTEKSVDDLKELCYQLDTLINELEYELESDSESNLFSLCTNFIDKLVDKE